MKYGEYDVYIDGAPSGKLEIVKTGLLTCFDCTAQPVSEDVMRLAADIGDKYETLGVMMPENGQLHLKKYFTKNDLYIKKLGDAVKYVLIGSDGEYAPPAEIAPEPISHESAEDTPLDGSECSNEDMPIAFDSETVSEEASQWSACPSPELLFNDSDAGDAIAGFPGVLTSEKDGFVYVAVPVEPEKPFPAAPVFFFGSQGSFNGRDYLVFQLKDGQIQI